MRIRINKTALQAALEKVQPGLASKELIEQSNSYAFVDGRVITYNDEISISHPVPGFDDVHGAVKAQVLYDFLSKVKKDEIELEWQENQMVIKAGRTKAGLVFESEVKLPLSEVGRTHEWAPLPNPQEFVEALKLCLPYCSEDMSHLVATCVHVKGRVVEASNNFQIMRCRLKENALDKAQLLPARAVRELVRYEVIAVATAESWVHFKTEDGTIFSLRTIEGEFPNTTKHLEVQGTSFTFPDSIQETLERAGIFALTKTDDIPLVLVEVKDKQLGISAKNESGWVQETARVKDYKGEDFRFNVGIEFLRSLLGKAQTCVVGENKIWFSGENWEHVIAVFVDNAATKE